MDYGLIRSKRKTLVICVSAGKVTVKAPLNASAARIQKFVEQKSGWIQKKLGDYSKKSDMFSGVDELLRVPYRGVFCNVVRCADKSRVCLKDGVLYLPQKYSDRESAQKAVKSFFKRLAKAELLRELGDCSLRTRLKFSGFAVSDAKTQWGSCDGKCNIRLNWRLVMLDDALRAYVMIHELSHTVFHNHSAEFWRKVGELMPDCAAQKKRLKSYSILTSLFR